MPRRRCPLAESWCRNLEDQLPAGGHPLWWLGRQLQQRTPDSSASAVLLTEGEGLQTSQHSQVHMQDTPSVSKPRTDVHPRLHLPAEQSHRL